MPSVSVIIPARITTDQQFDWLCEAVKSAARNRHVIEIIIGLDCKMALPQLRILSSLFDPVITADVGNYHSGAGAARNVAIKAAKGEYILPLDADDRLLPDSVDLLLAHAAPDKIVYGDVEYIGERVGLHRLPDYDLQNFLRFNGSAPVTGLHTKAAWKLAGGYDETIEALEDCDYYLRLATVGVTGYHVDKVTLRYRKHSGSRQSIAEQDKARYQEIRQYLYDKHKTLYTRGNMQVPCKTCPGQGGTGNGMMDKPAGVGANAITVRYVGPMEGQFTIQSWNVRDENGQPVKYSIQGRGATLEIDARDRGQFEARFHNGVAQFQFLDKQVPTPPPHVNIAESLPSLPKLEEMNAADSVEAIKGVNEAPDLFVLLAEEKSGKARKTVVEAINARLTELGSINPNDD